MARINWQRVKIGAGKAKIWHQKCMTQHKRPFWRSQNEISI